jgi:hypothetical protein
MSSQAHNSSNPTVGSNNPTGLVHDDNEIKNQSRDQPVAPGDRLGTGGSKTAELGKLTSNSIPSDKNFAGLGKGTGNPGEVSNRS